MASKKPLEIVLGGETRTLHYGVRAFRTARNAGYNLPFQNVGDIGIGDSATLIWIGLLHDNPGLEEDTVLGWLEEDGVDMSTPIRQAMDGVTVFFSRLVGNVKEGTPKKRSQT